MEYLRNIFLLNYVVYNCFLYFYISFLYIIFLCRQSVVFQRLPIAYKTLFELQPEDGFLKKPKHVTDLITF
jgi:hypothetical protein